MASSHCTALWREGGHCKFVITSNNIQNFWMDESTLHFKNKIHQTLHTNVHFNLQSVSAGLEEGFVDILLRVLQATGPINNAASMRPKHSKWNSQKKIYTAFFTHKTLEWQNATENDYF